MVDYEIGLGDLRFRCTKERELGWRLGQGEAPTRQLGRNPRAAAAAGGPTARVRVLVGQGVGLEGRPCPSFYRWRGGQGEGSPSPTRLGGAPAVGGGTPPPSRFQPPPLFPLPKIAVWLFKLAFDFQTRIWFLPLFCPANWPSTWCNHSILSWHIHVPFPSGVPDIPEPSRTFPMKTPEPFSNSETGLSLYESYSPDHSGSPRDIPDPIRDSEQHSVSFS